MEVADTTFRRTLGLMFRRKGEMLFTFPFDSRFSIWTPFMRFPIDLFFIDKNFKLVETRRGMVPWRFHKPRKTYRYLFEAPAGKYRGNVSQVVRKALLSQKDKRFL